MIRKLSFATVLGVWAGILVGGCGNPQAADGFEQRNLALTEKLNRTNSDLQRSVQERNALNERLAAAMRDIEALKAQLANQPEPQPAPAGWTSVPGGGMIAIEDGVLFASGRSVLRDEARRTLDGIVSTLQGEYGDKDIIIFGHTDDRPIKKSGWDDNWQLSSERALAVARFLQEHGVAANRLVAAGCGEHRPRVPNNTEPNRTANRRVEIFAIDPQALTGRTN